MNRLGVPKYYLISLQILTEDLSQPAHAHNDPADVNRVKKLRSPFFYKTESYSHKLNRLSVIDDLIVVIRVCSGTRTQAF